MRFLLFLLLFSISNLLFAQKPKLGLVLSGGGAKGMAHVGVLKELENAGLRPDYIAGTSMGSVVGAMYSLGYSADQIESILKGINWDEILSNNIPLNYISYEEKEYYNRYLLEFPIQGRKLKLPSGLIEGQLLSEAINHYTWPSMNYENFDEFPIPFRCVATDVSTGKEIIFKDGSLSEALRASMAIPTAFTATMIDSTLVVDGGIVNNFPANILKELGADIIVGMNVTRGFQDATKVNDLAGILMQISMLKSNQRLPEQRALCDVYIEPDLDDYNTASFSKYEEIIEIGHKEASRYSSKLDSVAKITGARILPSGVSDSNLIIYPAKIELEGNKLFDDKLIRSKLGFSENDSLSHKDLEEGIRRVYGINGFYKVEYSLEKEDGQFSLKLKMKEKPAATIKTSFHYDNNFSAGILLNLTVRDLLFRSSRTVVAGDISENPRFRFDYYKYAGTKKRAALNIRYNFINEQLPVYVGGEKVDLQINAENTFAVNLLSTQNLKNSVLIGAAYQANRFRSEFSGFLPPETEHVNFDFSRLVLAYTRNSLNNANYPTKGAERLFVGEAYVRSDYKIQFVNSDDSASFNSVLGRDLVFQNESEANDYLNTITPGAYGRFYFRSLDMSNVAKNFQIIPKLAFAGTLSLDSNVFLDDHYLGGYQQVRPTDTRAYGLHYAEKLVNNFGLVGLYFQNVFEDHFFLSYGVNAIGWYEHIPLNDLSSFDATKFWDEQTMLGYGIQIRYKSFVGPMTLGVSSNTQDGYVRVYFGIGYSFNFRD